MSNLLSRISEGRFKPGGSGICSPRPAHSRHVSLATLDHLGQPLDGRRHQVSSPPSGRATHFSRYPRVARKRARTNTDLWSFVQLLAVTPASMGSEDAVSASSDTCRCEHRIAPRPVSPGIAGVFTAWSRWHTLTRCVLGGGSRSRLKVGRGERVVRGQGPQRPLANGSAGSSAGLTRDSRGQRRRGQRGHRDCSPMPGQSG